jgi:uncharacterized iron-regulated membrane protein
MPGRILMSLMGVIVAMLSVTGIVIWARKRRSRLRRCSPNPDSTEPSP